MSHQTITYEIAIPRSLTVILATLAIGVLANALAPVFRIQTADADLVDKGDYLNPIHVSLQGPTPYAAIPVRIMTDGQHSSSSNSCRRTRD